MSRIVSENLANALVKLVAVDALPALMNELVMGNLVRRDFEPVTVQCGELTTVPTTDGDVLVKLDEMVEASVAIPDVTKIIAVPDLLRLYLHSTVTALAEKVDDVLLERTRQFDVLDRRGRDDEELAAGDLYYTDEVLFNAGVKAQEPRYLVTGSSTYTRLRQNQRFVEYASARDAKVGCYLDGPVGKLDGCFVVRSQRLTGAARGVAFVRDALVLAMRRLPKLVPGTGGIAEYAELGNFGMRVVMDYRPETLTQTFHLGLLFGAATVRTDFGVRLGEGKES